MKVLVFFIIVFVFWFSAKIEAQSIITTKHNLSVSGTGTVKATNETEICLFCHTPHLSKAVSPQWNRDISGSTYTLYKSSTLNALPGQPDGSTILCLSCHDGTVALGSVLSRNTDISFSSGAFMPTGKSNLTKNLRNDHPVSFIYDAGLASADGQLKPSKGITPPVALQNGKMQCTSCHDPHKSIYSDFLVATSQNSNLCNSCHQRTYWTTSSHNTSTKTWNSLAPDPWPFTDPSMTTVAQNGCESCHNPHNGGSDLMLLKYQAEENNCLDCHNGNVADKNISSQFAKTYRHNVSGYQNVHVANEASQVTNMHVECVDCHNPHAARNLEATAPSINGFLEGTKGISQSGVVVNPAINSYEVCYRCHAGSTGSPQVATVRLINQNNTRLEFATGNPSFHAVTGIGVNTSVPSLISPWTTASIMYCTTCHASDGASSPKGPHGSIYPYILKLQNFKTDNGNNNNGTVESASAYALCYSCHNRTSILADVSFKQHSKHLSKQIPCNSCHDPHGISSTQGNPTNNSNLINFRASVVTPPAAGVLVRFEDQGSFKGRCYLTCHGKVHNPLSY